MGTCGQGDGEMGGPHWEALNGEEAGSDACVPILSEYQLHKCTFSSDWGNGNQWLLNNVKCETKEAGQWCRP